MRRPTTEKLAQFITVRPPMTTLMACFFIIGMILLVFSNYINYHSGTIANPDIEIDWNTIFNKLNHQQFCLDEKEFVATSVSTSPVTLADATFYQKLSMSSVVSYMPLENYLSGSYHGRSQNFPLNYKFSVNATDLGILKVDKPKHLTEVQEKNYLYQLITIDVQFANYYESESKCGNIEYSEGVNKYSQEKQTDLKVACDSLITLACLDFYIPRYLYNNTALANAILPKPPGLNETSIKEIEPEAHSTFICENNLSKTNKVGSANVMSRHIKNEPCASYLTFKTGHEKDPKLVDYLSDQDISRIRGRLCWSAFVLIGMFGLYLLYGSFRGSGNYSYEAF